MGTPGLAFTPYYPLPPTRAWTPIGVDIDTNGLRAWQGTGCLRSEVSSGRGYGPAGVRVCFPYISLTGVESGKQEWTRVQCATAKSGKESGPKLRKSCAITRLR